MTSLTTTTAAVHHRCITGTAFGGVSRTACQCRNRMVKLNLRPDKDRDEESGLQACYGKSPGNGAFSIKSCSSELVGASVVQPLRRSLWNRSAQAPAIAFRLVGAAPPRAGGGRAARRSRPAARTAARNLVARRDRRVGGSRAVADEQRDCRRVVSKRVSGTGHCPARRAHPRSTAEVPSFVATCGSGRHRV